MRYGMGCVLYISVILLMLLDRTDKPSAAPHRVRGTRVLRWYRSCRSIRGVDAHHSFPHGRTPRVLTVHHWCLLCSSVGDHVIVEPNHE